MSRLPHRVKGFGASHIESGHKIHKQVMTRELLVSVCHIKRMQTKEQGRRFVLE